MLQPRGQILATSERPPNLLHIPDLREEEPPDQVTRDLNPVDQRPARDREVQAPVRRARVRLRGRRTLIRSHGKKDGN